MSKTAETYPIISFLNFSLQEDFTRFLRKRGGLLIRKAFDEENTLLRFLLWRFCSGIDGEGGLRRADHAEGDGWRS